MQLSLALRSGYSFIYIQTYEMDRYLKIIDKEMEQLNKWNYTIWDFNKDEEPEKVVSYIKESSPYTLIIAKNFNWFLKDNYENKYGLIQFIQNQCEEMSDPTSRKTLLIISNEDFKTAIPDSIQKDFIKLDFELPTKEEIEIILDNLIEDIKESNSSFKEPLGQEKQDLINSAIGLTARSCLNAFSYSIIKNGEKFDCKVVAEIRSSEINETNGLTVAIYENMDDVIGCENAKEFISSAIDNPISKGVLFVGPPGTGKTQLAKWASNISGKMFIEFDLAKVQGQGLYGQAEAEMANALKVPKAVKNCVLFVDEIEKSIPSKQSTNDTTGTRSFGQLLKFLSDEKPDGCFVMATCNDISKLPPEWIRSERFDVIFYIGLPTNEQKQAIFKYYRAKYGVKSDRFTFNNMINWTGAEIKTVCRIAKMLKTDIDNASRFVVPIAKTMQADIEYLEKWKDGRTIEANLPEKQTKKKRSIELK